MYIALNSSFTLANLWFFLTKAGCTLTSTSPFSVLWAIASNFITYPIILVKAKKPVTINNGVNLPMNISIGQVGTFQEIDNPTALGNSNDRLAEATFGGNKIRFHFIGEPSNQNRMRELILKNNEFDIISASSPSRITKTNYSNITRTVSEATPVTTAPTVTTAPSATEEVVVPPRTVGSSTPVTPVTPVATATPFNPSTPVFIATSTSLPNPTNPSSPTLATILTPLPMPSAVSQSTPVNPPAMPMGGGGGGTAPAPTTEESGGGSGAREGDILGAKTECKSNYWIIGLAVGAVVGYLLNDKKENLLKSLAINSAMGGGIGYGIDLWVCRKKKVEPVAPPATEPKK